MVNPNTHDFIEYTIKPLADRMLAGEDREVVTNELFEAVLPWVQSQIRREQSHMPTGADAAEISSQMLTAAWRFATKFDPTCPQSWPTGLKRRLQGAWLEAYRSVDYITRKQRALNNVWRNAVEMEINQRGRELSHEEKMDIARQVAPPSRVTDWATTIVNNTPPPALGGDAVDWEVAAGQTGEHTDPCIRACDAQLAGQVQGWMTKLPSDLQEKVAEALRLNRPISKATRARLAPYIPELLGYLDDTDDFVAAMPVAVGCE